MDENKSLEHLLAGAEDAAEAEETENTIPSPIYEKISNGLDEIIGKLYPNYNNIASRHSPLLEKFSEIFRETHLAINLLDPSMNPNVGTEKNKSHTEIAKELIKEAEVAIRFIHGLSSEISGIQMIDENFSSVVHHIESVQNELLWYCKEGHDSDKSEAIHAMVAMAAVERNRPKQWANKSQIIDLSVKRALGYAKSIKYHIETSYVRNVFKQAFGNDGTTLDKSNRKLAIVIEYIPSIVHSTVTYQNGESEQRTIYPSSWLNFIDPALLGLQPHDKIAPFIFDRTSEAVKLYFDHEGRCTNVHALKAIS